ncbi:MAG: SMC-Scp complex subunit ScpB [Rhodospirillales bacterium]|nr:SMC-Scp complex subunit ScpB [Rhodospirillales bacterium]
MSDDPLDDALDDALAEGTPDAERAEPESDDEPAVVEVPAAVPALDLTDDFLKLRLVEALVFASAEPVAIEAIAQRLPDGTDVVALLTRLAEQYANRGVHLVRVDEKWAFRTAPDLGPALRMEAAQIRKLSRAAIETLAIIAYHQPVTRSEIEEVRGVALSKGTLDALFEAGWIKPKGRRRNSPGRPVVWATTESFLDHFGLEAIEDLPGLEELKAAGLLDSRPTMAYGAKADDEGPPVDVDEEPPEPLTTEADSEPLSPEAGGEADAHAATPAGKDDAP